MKKIVNTKVISNVEIEKNIWDMKIFLDEPCVFSEMKPGQFLQIYMDNNKNLLPRPISICEYSPEENFVRIVYHVVGQGTEILSSYTADSPVRIMVSCGNGFNVCKKDKNVLVVGGGIGIPPMLGLCQSIIKESPDTNINVVLGYRDSTFLKNDFQSLGGNVTVYTATDSGVTGFKGNVVELLESENLADIDMIFSCGPNIMLKNLYFYAEKNNFPIQVSMEERMACGIGACVGCVVKLKTETGWEYKKTCKDGPVFLGSKVVWND